MQATLACAGLASAMVYFSPEYSRTAQNISTFAVAAAHAAFAGDTASQAMSRLMQLAERIGAGEEEICPRSKVPGICKRDFAVFRERVEKFTNERIDEALIAGDANDAAKEKAILAQMQVAYRTESEKYEQLRQRHGP